MTDVLLAKSKGQENGQNAVSLLDHSKAVLAAARAIIDEVEEYLPAELPKSDLRKLVISGAVLHDLGKANGIFQGKLHPQREEFPKIPWHQRQPLRHEGLSALIIAGYVKAAEKFSADLETELFSECENPEISRWMLAWLVGGHHLQMHHAEDDSSGLVRISGIGSDYIRFHGDLLGKEWQREFPEVLPEALYVPDFCISTNISDGDDHHAALMDNFAWESEELAESLSLDELLLLAFAKAILIAADVAGSALWDGEGDEITRLESGVRASLRNHYNQEDLKAIVRTRLKVGVNADYGTELYPFQRQVRDASKTRVVLEAACGGGKTIAAYEWARQYAEAGRKLVICYPTTGTAAAGFDDYLFAQEELERSLISSRASVDIRRMLANEPEATRGEERELRHPNRDQDLENLMKQDSLEAWGQQAIAATADFVLGLMQNHRRGLFSFPVILKSAIVFDEIHSYDAKMFGSLVRFLRTFPQIPVLLMTASLQPSRREALDAVGVDYELIPGDDNMERAGRYRLEWYEKNKKQSDVSDKYWEAVKDTLDNRGKVLWVCNTVADATCIYDEAEQFGNDVKRILFHSRFCYRHRVNRQNEILAAFNEDKGPCLAVTTQVCEMSLDISANLLVTALPTFPALVQRMGRLNRRYPLESPDGARCLVYDYDGMDGRPYLRADLNAARAAVKKLAEKRRVLSQHDLNNALNEMPEKVDDIKFHSSWLDGGWESKSSTLREGEATVPVLLVQHEDEIREGLNEIGKNPAVKEWLVPILASKQIGRVGSIGGYPLVSGVEYDEEKGAR
ncbi:MAG: CRISPR-associated helicase Cas3' [Gemmatimonadetes bacterium]|nr:CRISPR-associated helicase Cas3' [Gemmatimonadota bacterium]